MRWTEAKSARRIERPRKGPFTIPGGSSERDRTDEALRPTSTRLARAPARSQRRPRRRLRSLGDLLRAPDLVRDGAARGRRRDRLHLRRAQRRQRSSSSSGSTASRSPVPPGARADACSRSAGLLAEASFLAAAAPREVACDVGPVMQGFHDAHAVIAGRAEINRRASGSPTARSSRSRAVDCGGSTSQVSVSKSASSRRAARSPRWAAGAVASMVQVSSQRPVSTIPGGSEARPPEGAPNPRNLSRLGVVARCCDARLVVARRRHMRLAVRPRLCGTDAVVRDDHRLRSTPSSATTAGSARHRDAEHRAAAAGRAARLAAPPRLPHARPSARSCRTSARRAARARTRSPAPRCRARRSGGRCRCRPTSLRMCVVSQLVPGWWKNRIQRPTNEARQERADEDLRRDARPPPLRPAAEQL